MRSKEREKIKEVKRKKKSLIFDIIFILLSLVASIYLIHSLLQLKRIETVIRYIIISIIILINLIMIINLFKRNKKKKRIKKCIKRLFLLILIIIYIVIGYNINYILSKIDNMNKETVTNTTSLVTLKTNKIGNVKDIYKSKIGIGSDKNSTEGYVLPMEIVKQYDLDKNNELVSYDDYLTMITDLYNKKIDYIFLPSGYTTMYNSIEQFEEIENETKVLVSTSKEEEKEEELRGSSTDVSKPFTILLMGVDSTTDSIKNANSFNGDSLMLITFNPSTLNVTMLNIPRDTYVPISCMGNADNKITHSASQGAKCVINTIQNFTGIKIDYYAKINFKGLVDLVNAVGGVEVDVPYSFCEQNSKRKWGKNTIYVKKGKQILNGEQALALARNRKNNAKKCGTEYSKGTRNDFVRGQNQQLVIHGLINKVKKINSIGEVYNILDSISNSLDTNMSRDTILSFYNVVKDIMTTKKNKDGELVSIQKLFLAGSDQIIYDERSHLELYNYIPNQSSKAAIINAMKVNLGLIKDQPETSFNYSIGENYETNVIGKNPTAATTLYTLIPDFTTYTRNKAENWALSNGFTIIWKEVTVNSSSQAGRITKQSYPRKKRVDLCNPKSITLTITVNKSSSVNYSSNNENNNENSNSDNNTNSYIEENSSTDNKDDNQ